jgi:hypothetical protein
MASFAAILLAVLAAAPAPHVRGESERAAALLRDGTTRSGTIRTLVAELERSDVFVFLDIDIHRGVLRGKTTLLTGNAAGRYLHVTVSFQTDPDRQVEMLAHELQHCAEIARAPDVRDVNTLRTYMARIGRRLGADDFETDAARAIEFVVGRELLQGQKR